ncbi:hypothetical protein ACTFIY_001390 [Dictyostelium cf. discoideum]
MVGGGEDDKQKLEANSLTFNIELSDLSCSETSKISCLSPQHLKERLERRLNALKLGVENGNISKAARDHNLTKDTLYYYWNDFRHGKVRQSHGGKRRTPTFTKEQYQLLVTIVVEVVKEKPNLGMNEIAQFLNSQEGTFFQGKVLKYYTN